MEKLCWQCKRRYPDDRMFCERDGARLVLKDGFAGQTVAGKYHLEGLIGEGGYGQVYVGVLEEPIEAAGLKTGAAVAVKLVVRRGQSTAQWDKLKHDQGRETRVSSRIRNEHLVPIYDSGEDEGTRSLFTIMPLGARDLKTILGDEGPASPDYEPSSWLKRAAAVGVQIGGALGALHAGEICHRDVKPQNVMEFSGRMMLIDYNISKEMHASASKSSGNTVRGTVDYMAPDYWGEEGKLDWEKIDQYSYGVMMYELFAGVLPFTGPDGPGRDNVVMQKHMSAPPPPIRNRRPEVPEVLEEAILKMMSKTPEGRFKNMAAAFAAFAQVGRGKPAPVPAPVKGKEGAGPEIELSGVEVETDAKTGRKRYILRF